MNDRKVIFEDSRAIRSAAYDLERRELRVHFLQTNSLWLYKDVPLTIFGELVVAESVGNFFNHVIRPYYDAERISPHAKEPHGASSPQQEEDPSESQAAQSTYERVLP